MGRMGSAGALGGLCRRKGDFGLVMNVHEGV